MPYDNAPGQVDNLTRIMAEEFHLVNKPKKSMGFLSFFGTPENGSQSLFTDDETDVSIDIIKDDTTIGVLAERGADGQNESTSQGDVFTVTEREFPISKGTGRITKKDIERAKAGERKYSGSMTQQERLLVTAGNIYNSKIRSQLWLHESLAQQSLLFGEMKTNEYGGKFDFKRNPDNTFSAAFPWTDQVNSDPLADLDVVANLVDLNGLEECNFIGMGTSVYQAFINHPKVQTIADNRRYDIAWVGGNSNTRPDASYNRHIQAGWMPRAYVTLASGAAVWIFTYNKWFKDPTKTTQYYMPKDKLFGTSTDARFDRYFGPDDKLPQEYSTNSVIEKFFGIINEEYQDALEEGANSIIDPRMFKYFAYGNDNNTAIKLEVQSAPIYAPTNVDAVALMNDVVILP